LSLSTLFEEHLGERIQYSVAVDPLFVICYPDGDIAIWEIGIVATERVGCKTHETNECLFFRGSIEITVSDAFLQEFLHGFLWDFQCSLGGTELPILFLVL